MTGWNTDTLAQSAGAGAITIVEGSSFCVSHANGDIVPELPHGMFFRDTRLVSRSTLLIDGAPIEPLSAMTPEPFRALVVGRAGHLPGRADTPLTVERDRRIDCGLREEITIRNYSRMPMTCRVELALEADFADIFEVKEERAGGAAHPLVAGPDGRLHAESANAPDRLGLVVTADGASVDAARLVFEIGLPPHGCWTQLITITPTLHGDEVELDPIGAPLRETSPARRLTQWQSSMWVPTIDDDDVERIILQSQRDLGSLRIFDPRHPERAVVAAGVPWFMALFGRDSLLASYMTLGLDPTLAVGTLQTLAELQGAKSDPASEEQPGRILHEVRLGATTNLALGGESVYYGSVDATPLFVFLLGELAAWGALPDDDATTDELIAAADRALDWIERDGDRDGDGFVEYGRLNDFGLINQGWKDSWDGINFADGTLAEAPIALCEVQGYVYAAYRARATIAASRGDDAGIDRWNAKAVELKARFNERFWMPERRCFAVALDRDKRQVDACTSNMGHCQIGRAHD